MGERLQDERSKRAADLGYRALEESRTRLMTAFRFLDRALWRMPLVAEEQSALLATDGLLLAFSPGAVLGTYRAKPNEVVRALLHSVFHCVFRHPFRTVRKDVALWNLACDICVEAAALQMCGERFPTRQDAVARKLAERIEKDGCALVPSQVYRLLLLTRNDPQSRPWLASYATDPQTWGAPFARDGHERWDLVSLLAADADEGDDQRTSADSPRNGKAKGRGKGEKPDSDATDEPSDASSADQGDGANECAGQGREESNAAPQANAAQEQQDAAGSAGAPDGQPAGAAPQDAEDAARAQEEWKAVSQQIETEMRSFANTHGWAVGRLEENLVLANRSAVNYEDFLRRFCVLDERLQTNDEEFDYLFYTYGLARYGNMPLIEPLEYRDVKTLRDFVIAVDTSGSCDGELVRTFLTRTCELLLQANVGASQSRVHIVQCDAEVQSDTVIASEADLAAMMEHPVVRGKGGTDFRPVFSYVEDLVARGELGRVRGLVYFTDGYGTFPAHPPDYDVAFVFVEEEGKQRRVPAWACKVIMGQDDIELLEGKHGY